MTDFLSRKTVLITGSSDVLKKVILLLSMSHVHPQFEEKFIDEQKN